MGQIYQPDSDPNDSIRYYLNSRASSEDSWLTEPAIQSHLAYRDLYGRAVGSSSRLDGVWKDFIDEDEEITLGFDGSIRNDSTALVGCRVSDGLLFLIKLQQRPDNADLIGVLTVMVSMPPCVVCSRITMSSAVSPMRISSSR